MFMMVGKMKVLVLGCNGMAGHLISLYFKEQGHEVLGIAQEKSFYVNSVVIDVKNLDLLKNVIDEGEFDAVINCIGILNQFAEQNKENAVFLNSYLPHYLAKITATMKTKIVHMSTDCVFSGSKGNYTEKDFTDGETFYDRSKALGELNDDKNITLRNSIIGPDINENGIGLLNWFMKQNGKISGYTKSIWTGQTTLQLAKTMERAILQNAHGLVNMVPDTSINKYDLLQLFNKYFKNNSLDITAVDGINANKALIRTNFDFDYIIPSYEVMIKELAEWIENHKEMYNY